MLELEQLHAHTQTKVSLSSNTSIYPYFSPILSMPFHNGVVSLIRPEMAMIDAQTCFTGSKPITNIHIPSYPKYQIALYI